MTSCGEVKMGDRACYRGRPFIVRGFTFLSSSTQHVFLEDEETAERATVPLAEVPRIKPMDDPVGP
jgi:hypothetical protein